MSFSYLKGLKTWWERVNLLIMSNFSFSHHVSVVSQGRNNKRLCGKGLTFQHLQVATLLKHSTLLTTRQIDLMFAAELTLSKQTLDFTCLQYKSLKNTEKRRNCS